MFFIYIEDFLGTVFVMAFIPYIQFNSAFMCGAFLGNCMRESIYGGNTGGSNVGNFNGEVFANNWSTTFPVQPCNIFNLNIFQPSLVQMPVVQQNWFGINFNNIGANFSTGWNNFSNMLVQPFNSNFNRTNIGSTQKVNNVKYAKLEDYNAGKGKKLANIVYENTTKRFDVNWNCIGSKDREKVIDHDCARHVALAINQAGLGDCRVDSAYQMTGKLRNNPNFKELPVEGADLDNLPPGTVCIYNPNKHGYSSKHGHVVIKTEDGCAAEHYSKKLLTPDYIFMPV